jgi:CubicO group peptidase (beta-lactamase class C family)
VWSDEGKWKGEQIVSSEWINEMTSEKIIVDDSVYDDIHFWQWFGYQWWGFEVENKYKRIEMSGAGGQSATIYKTQNLIVVMTAEPNTEGGYHLSEGDILLKIEESLLK